MSVVGIALRGFGKALKKVEKKAADGGMIKQAQRNYTGSYISGDLGGVKVSNPSLKKYYKSLGII